MGCVFRKPKVRCDLCWQLLDCLAVLPGSPAPDAVSCRYMSLKWEQLPQPTPSELEAQATSCQCSSPARRTRCRRSAKPLLPRRSLLSRPTSSPPLQPSKPSARLRPRCQSDHAAGSAERQLSRSPGQAHMTSRRTQLTRQTRQAVPSSSPGQAHTTHRLSQLAGQTRQRLLLARATRAPGLAYAALFSAWTRSD